MRNQPCASCRLVFQQDRIRVLHPRRRPLREVAGESVVEGCEPAGGVHRVSRGWRVTPPASVCGGVPEAPGRCAVGMRFGADSGCRVSANDDRTLDVGARTATNARSAGVGSQAGARRRYLLRPGVEGTELGRRLLMVLSGACGVREGAAPGTPVQLPWSWSSGTVAGQAAGAKICAPQPRTVCPGISTHPLRKPSFAH